MYNNDQNQNNNFNFGNFHTTNDNNSNVNNNSFNQNNNNFVNPAPSNSNINNNYFNPTPNNYENSLNTNAPKNNKTLLIIICVVVGILAIVGVYFLVTSGGGTPHDFEKEYKEKIAKENEEIIKNIKTDTVKLANGDYLVILENNNSKPINAEGTVELYNNDSLVYTKEIFFNRYIKANEKGYAILRKSGVSGFTFNKIEPKISSYYYLFKTYDGKIAHTEEVKDGSLVVAITNNTNETLGAYNIEALYYDANNNIIGYETGYLSNNLTPGSTNYESLDLPTNENYDDIPFSRYEVIVLAEENY